MSTDPVRTHRGDEDPRRAQLLVEAVDRCAGAMAARASSTPDRDRRPARTERVKCASHAVQRIAPGAPADLLLELPEPVSGR